MDLGREEDPQRTEESSGSWLRTAEVSHLRASGISIENLRFHSV